MDEIENFLRKVYVPKLTSAALGYGLAGEHFPRVLEALGLISSTEEKTKTKLTNAEAEGTEE